VLDEVYMDAYGSLSRESLIHEIRQLNKTIETLKFKMDSQEANLLDLVKFPIMHISSEYDILWANQYAVEQYDRLYHRKCYQGLYGFNDICTNCPMKEVLSYKVSMNVLVVDKNAKNWHNTLMPVVEGDTLSGILEFQQRKDERVQVDEEFKDAIARLRQENQELHRKLEIKNDFIKIFSRKLMTPIKAIRGIHTSLENTYLSQVQSEYLTVLSKNSRLIHDIFNRALMQADMEESVLPNPKQEFDLVGVMTALVTMAKAQFEIVLNYDEAMPKIVLGDETNFTLALYLLLETAVSTGTHKRIFLNATSISETIKNVNIKLTITDRPDNRQTALKNFTDTVYEHEAIYQSLESYIASVGIQVGKKIIEALNGTLIISRTEGKGVHMTLFISFEKVMPRQTVQLSVATSEKAGILFVDEERPPVSLEMFDRYNIYFAKSKEQAVTLFTAHMPDITMINIMLSDEDGFRIFDAVERYRQEGQYLFATSVKLIDNERDFMRDYGFDDYYEKPLRQSDLKEIFKLYINR
jgi:CheY-like chemotaxis protein